MYACTSMLLQVAKINGVDVENQDFNIIMEVCYVSLIIHQLGSFLPRLSGIRSVAWTGECDDRLSCGVLLIPVLLDRCSPRPPCRTSWRSGGTTTSLT